MGTIDRNFYIGNVLQKLHINRYKIIALQRSPPRKLTSRILALSEVKAILFSGRYATRIVTYFSSYLGGSRSDPRVWVGLAKLWGGWPIESVPM